jgi:hypothetical protein
MSAAAAGSTARPESTRVVLWVTLAVCALAGAIYTMATQTTHALEARAELARWFELRDLPAGFELCDAQRLPRGDVTVRFELTGAGVEAPRVPVVEVEGPKQPFDWSTVAVGESGTEPREVLIAELPLASADDELRELFQGGMNLNGDWKSVPREGGKRVLDRGTLPWGPYAAPYVVEREFESGATFRDFVRVDLSRPKLPRIFVARWSRGFPASKGRVEELLKSFPPR